MPNFVVNIVLPAGTVQPDLLIADFFDSAMERVAWHDKRNAEKQNNAQVAAVYQYVKDELLFGKASAKVEKAETGVRFTFVIRDMQDRFSVKNEEGARPWLRQHLDDNFFHYALPQILSNSLDWKQDKPALEKTRMAILDKAFTLALAKAYLPNSDTFWIEGE